jgi:fructosamine-3-kinase
VPVDDLSIICDSISEHLGQPFKLTHQHSLSGGCINQCFQLEGENSASFFLKQNRRSFFPFFEAEALALREILDTDTIRVPKVISVGETENSSFLILEFISEGSPSQEGQKKLGVELAKLHKIEKSYFGWKCDNCIGATPQLNPSNQDWISFYRDSRLLYQFNLAHQKNVFFEGETTLSNNLEFFFDSHLPVPSLVHGDLWGGNAGFSKQGTPFIFDPASYYGDRETDLAFTYMFGGFSPSFYEGYEEIFPLDQGFSSRKILYNLYHELNHFNLFGGGYAKSAQSSIHQLIQKLP